MHTYKNVSPLRSNQVSDAVCRLGKKGEAIGGVRHADGTKTYYIGQECKIKDAKYLEEYAALKAAPKTWKQDSINLGEQA